VHATCRDELELEIELSVRCECAHRGEASTVSDDRQAAETAGAPESRVEALAREIAQAINEEQVEQREFLREVAVNLLRDEVYVTSPSAQATPAESTGSFNAFGIGIPLFLMGTVLVFLFPPVGLLMFAAAAVMIAWGVGATLLAHS
jgi:hypothetical protein